MAAWWRSWLAVVVAALALTLHPNADAKTKTTGKATAAKAAVLTGKPAKAARPAAKTKATGEKGKATATKPAKGKPGKAGDVKGKGAEKAEKAATDEKPLTAKQKKAQAKEREAIKKLCADKKEAKTKKCKAFAKAEAERAAEDAAAKLDDKCKDKAARKSKECKAHLAKRSKPEKDPCGRRYGRARKAETVAKFAKRYGVSEARVRELNDLSEKTKKLKAGKRLLVAKSPHDGVVLAGGVHLPVDDAYTLRRPYNAYGKPLMVDLIVAAARQVQAQHPLQPPLMVGDLSKDGGGCLPPHKSHRGGLDADIGYYLRGAFTAPYLADATADTLDADRTWLFLRALLATGRVQYAFVHYSLQPALYEAALRAGETPQSLAKVIQYPRPQADWLHTPIRHLDGHDDHLHLRLQCGNEACDLPPEAKEAIAQLQVETLGGPATDRAGGPAPGRRRAGSPILADRPRW
ncbi:MAG: penicillin-insensitive murein endopeptidase [Deltaproteobacteria bacterium]|nr:penicillin-insensitive murein endopeptidase [Deltaproteobacteria bacterium]